MTATTVATPGGDGYGWGVDDSARLRAEVDRRANRQVPRAPIRDVVAELAARDLARRGQSPDELLARMADPAVGDALIERADREARQDRLARQADILLARLPAMYRNADFPRAGFGQQARTWLADYRADVAAGRSPRSLVILGGTGTGKTWTLCAIARALLTEDTVPVTVVTVSELLASLRPAQGGLDVDLLQYSSAPVLGLDDMGSERLTEWGTEQLYRLAHERSHNGRPTIVTSNLTGPQIRERYDPRTVERLFGGAQLIEIHGETRRPMPF